MRKSAGMNREAELCGPGWPKRISWWVTLALTIPLAGCGGSLYKVKPVVEAPVTETGRSAGAGGINVSAVPLLTDEESQELFESNLPLIGLLPVRVEMVNTSGAPVAFRRVRFHLRDGAGKEWKSRSAKQAISRILSANEVTLYNPQSRAGFQEAFLRHAFDTETPLGAAERRQGLIFFQTPGKEPVESPRGLVLGIEGLPQPIELRLN